MGDTKKIKRVEFAPGVLEQLEQEMTPEELQSFLDEIKEAAMDGSLLDKSIPLDMDELKRTDPDLYNTLVKQLEEFDTQRTNILH